MKNLLGLLTITIFLFSCGGQQNCSNGQQDSGETGVDCGGNCPPCAVPTGGGSGSGSGGSGGGTQTNTTLQSLQGLWYHTHHSLHLSGVQTYVFNNNTNSSCKVDFSSTPYNAVAGYYEMYGNPQSLCTYPISGIYDYNSSNNLINSIIYVESVTSNNLHLSVYGGITNNNSQGQDYYMSKTAPSLGPSETVSWQVNLASSYPTNGQVQVSIRKSWDIANPISVPIVAGQLSYSGSLTANTAANNYVIVSVGSVTSSQPTPNTIEFSSSTSIGNVTGTVPNQLYCFISQGCTSGENIVNSWNHLIFK